MNRDVLTAAIAAFSLLSLAGLWALYSAESLADPGGTDQAKPAITSLPVPPKLPDRSAARARAEALFAETQLMRGKDDIVAGQRRLATAKINPPVRLDPVTAPPERRLRARPAPPRTAVIAPPPAQPPRPVAPAQTVVLPAPTPTPSPAAIERYQQPPAQPQPILTARPDTPSIRLRGIVPHPTDGVRVLLAISDGRIVTASLGAQVEGWQVVKIARTSVTLQARNGRAVELRMLGY